VTDWTAIVLTGGGSRRLGRDKITTDLGGRRLIDRVLEGLPPEAPVVVVGPDPGTARPVTVTREQPPGGGPAAGIAAGLEHVRTPLVAVLAADMPFAVPALQALPLPQRDAVVPRADGHPQPLCALYRTVALRAAAPRAGMSMRALLAHLDVEYLDLPAADFADIDTEQDLEAAQRQLIMGDMDTWVEAVKQELGLEADVDVAVILDVAKDAAHAVQRPAAPVTTYLLGLAVAGGADAATAAAAIARLAQAWPGDA
jgi:molybdopterin-guanine dinucleotide biosynthesis protein A